MTAIRIRRPRSRALDGLVAGVGIVALLVLLAARPPSVQAAPAPLAVKSSWSDAVEAQFITWTNEFAGAASPVNFTGQALSGDEAAKEAVIDGRFQFVVAGSPLNEEEQLAAGAHGREIVAVPLTATGLVIGVRAPTGGWQVRSTVEDPPESGIFPPVPLDPAVSPRLSTALVSRLFTLPNVKLPADADFKRDMNPITIASTNSNLATAGVVRADPGGLNRQLQRYLRQFELTYWQSHLTAVGVDVDYLGADWPVKRTPSRAGRTAVATAVASETSPEAGGQTKAINGTVGIFTLADWHAAKAQYPTVDLRAAEIRNAAGEWILPTPETVTKGIEAGITADGFVESATVSATTATGAYPMTWVNWMLVPTTGIPPAEVNAVANLARHAVTGGQAIQPTVGEPTLPAGLVDQALSTIDDFVRSNCAAANGIVRTANNPGTAAPPAASFPGITSFVLCDAPIQPAATTTSAVPGATTTKAPTGSTTTTTTPSATTIAPAGTNSSPGGSSGSRSRTTRRATTTTAPPSATTEAPATTIPPTDEGEEEFVGTDPATLPYGNPVSSPQAYDRLATMAVGGSLAYGALRRFFFRSS